MTWLRSHWLRSVVLPVLLALLRASWLWLWLEIIRSSVAASVAPPLLSIPVLAGFYLASLFTARLLLSGRLSLAAARPLEAVAGLAAIVMLIWWRFHSSQFAIWDTRWLADLGRSIVSWEGELPGAMIVLPILIYLWLRGVLDAGSALYRDDVWGAFTAGFAVLALAGVAAVAGGRGLPAGAHEAVFLFFAVGLAAIAIASLETTGSMAARRGDEQVRFDRYWFASVGSVIAAMLLAGFIISALVTPQSVAGILRWTTAVLDVLGMALYYVLLVISYVVFLFLEPLLHLAQRALTGSRQEQSEPMEMPDFEQQLKDIPRGQATLPDWLTNLLPWLGLVAAILIVAVVFAVALRRLYKTRNDELLETRESILTRSLLQEQLASLSRRLRRQRSQPGDPFLSLDGEEGTRRAIRSAYQSLLAAMRSRGQARRRDQTPSEYGDALARAWPQEEQELDTLTSAYRKARYARQAPSTEEADAARRAWRDVQQTIEPAENDTTAQRGDAA